MKDRDELLRMLECSDGLRKFEENELPHPARNRLHPAQWKWQRNCKSLVCVQKETVYTFLIDQRPFPFSGIHDVPLHLASSARFETWQVIPEGTQRPSEAEVCETLKEKSGNFRKLRRFRFVLREACPLNPYFP